MKLNNYFAIGNLVKDAETKIMSNGKKKQIFTLAINDDYKNKENQTDDWIHRAYFINCYVVGKEYQNLTKGRKILINGKLVTKNYEKNTEKRTLTMIEVFTLDFMYQKENGVEETIPAKTTDDISNLDEEQLPF